MRFIRLKEVMHVTGLGRSSIYNYMAEGRFPKTVSLGGRAVAWVESKITDWMLERVSGRHSF
jgi:prophage regulatory protein